MRFGSVTLTRLAKVMQAISAYSLPDYESDQSDERSGLSVVGVVVVLNGAVVDALLFS